jgi:thiol:disulfide interchange protein DsbD
MAVTAEGLRLQRSEESQMTKRETKTRRWIRTLLLVLVTLGWVPIWAGAEVPQSSDELPAEFPRPTVQAYLSHEALAAGGSGAVLVSIDVVEASHLQLNEFLELRAPEGAPIKLGNWEATRLETYGKDQVLKGHTALTFPFRIDAGAAAGPIDLTLIFAYQGCVETPSYACYAPEEVELPVRIEVLPAGAAARVANAEVFRAHGVALAPPVAAASTPATSPDATPTTPVQTPAVAPATPPASEPAASSVAPPAASSGGSLASKLEGALAKRSLLAFLLVFLGGVLTSFTPCVYPMIPITISYIGGRSKHHAHGFFLSLFFVLGIAIMYSALGLLAASTGSVFGSALQSTAVLVVVAIIFAAMGASMLGAFDLALPAGLQGRMTAGAQRGGVLGAVLMGMVTGLIASPCVGPVLVVLLTFVAKTGSLFLGFWLLFVFACGLGLLFLVLGTFAGALNALPGAGAWMETIKRVFGVILIGMAIFYLRTVIGPSVTRVALGIYLVFVAIFSGALTPLPESPTRGRLFGKSVAVLLLLTGAALFLVWIAGLAGFPARGPGALPGGSAAPGVVATHPGPAWRVNDETALAEAKAAGRPAMQDFYADWCAACVELDEKTWSDPAVIAEAQRFVALKMDFTRRDAFSKAATTRYAVRGMPTVVFYDSQGNEVTRFAGFHGPQEVLARMRSVK